MGGATRHVGLSAVRHQHASRQQRKGENGGPQDKKLTIDFQYYFKCRFCIEMVYSYDFLC